MCGCMRLWLFGYMRDRKFAVGLVAQEINFYKLIFFYKFVRIYLCVRQSVCMLCNIFFCINVWKFPFPLTNISFLSTNAIYTCIYVPILLYTALDKYMLHILWYRGRVLLTFATCLCSSLILFLFSVDDSARWCNNSFCWVNYAHGLHICILIYYCNFIHTYG